MPHPWKRTALEGLVIVTSILLAFGIDRSWDAVQDRRDASLLRQSLRSEFAAVRDSLQAGLRGHQSFLQQARRLSTFDAASRDSAPDFATVYQVFVVYTSTAVRTGVLDGALASGRLDLLPAELGAELASWPRALGEFLEEEAHVADLANATQHVLATAAPIAVGAIGYRLEPDKGEWRSVPEALSAFLATDQARNYAALRASHEFLAVRDGQRLLGVVDGILAMLGSESR